mgnify:CR=1 FL=1
MCGYRLSFREQRRHYKSDLKLPILPLIRYYLAGERMHVILKSERKLRWFSPFKRPGKVQVQIARMTRSVQTATLLPQLRQLNCSEVR